ncbi:MAG: inositol monophosphatase [Planctomycetes bacterium]|nr:inositol monophosphatase [Planctomycetota bacterium]
MASTKIRLIMTSFADALVSLGRHVRDRIRRGFLTGPDRMSRPEAQGVGDLQYSLDVLGEDGLIEETRRLFGGGGPLRLLSEGLPAEGEIVFAGEGGHLLVVDPVDGTRGLMHDKRSAFFLAGIAPDGPAPRLRAVRHACLVEIPTSRSLLSDVLVVSPERGLQAWTEDLGAGTRVPLVPTPSGNADLDHGFATIARFFGGAGAAMGTFHDAFLERVFPGDPDAWMGVFEDQYICNGGQMHALVTGRDRFVADLRPLFERTDGGRLMCSHPYDVLALPIAEAAGVVVTGADGAPLDVPLDLSTDVAWIGYASEALRHAVEPRLQEALRACGHLP